MDNAAFVTTQDIAAQTGRSKQAISTAVRLGVIPKPMLIGRSHAWLASEMPAVIEAMTARSKRRRGPARRKAA